MSCVHYATEQKKILYVIYSSLSSTRAAYCVQVSCMQLRATTSTTAAAAAYQEHEKKMFPFPRKSINSSFIHDTNSAFLPCSTCWNRKYSATKEYPDGDCHLCSVPGNRIQFQSLFARVSASTSSSSSLSSSSSNEIWTPKSSLAQSTWGRERTGGCAHTQAKQQVLPQTQGESFFLGRFLSKGKER